MLCFFSSKCANVMMQVPQELKVRGKEAKVSSFTGIFDSNPIIFKPFIATDVEIEAVKSNTSKTPIELSDIPNAEAQQKFSFKLLSENTPVSSSTQCLVQDKAESLLLEKKVKRKIERLVTCETIIGSQKYELRLKSGKLGLSGFLMSGNEKIELEVVDSSIGGMTEDFVLGYTFKRGEILAAVNLRDDFSFWYLTKNSDQLNSALASASVSLMVVAKRGSSLK